MPPKTLHELAVPGVPELGVVIPPGTGDRGTVGRKLDVVDLVLMSEQPRYGLRSVVGGIP